MASTSAFSVSAENGPRGFSWTAAASSRSLIFLLPWNSTWLTTEYSSTCTTSVRADLIDAHIGEQAGAEQALHRLVDVGAGERLARA